MNSEELEELAREAVELPGWRWWWTSEERPLKGGEWYRQANVLVMAEMVEALRPGFLEPVLLPDLTHSGVGGILLEMLKPVLRQSWHDSDYSEWIVELEPSEDYSLLSVTAPHLAEACALAAVGLGGWPEAQDA